MDAFDMERFWGRQTLSHDHHHHHQAWKIKRDDLDTDFFRSESERRWKRWKHVSVRRRCWLTLFLGLCFSMIAFVWTLHRPSSVLTGETSARNSSDNSSDLHRPHRDQRRPVSALVGINGPHLPSNQAAALSWAPLAPDQDGHKSSGNQSFHSNALHPEHFQTENMETFGASEAEDKGRAAFDCVYVINLDRCRERYEWSVREAKKHSLRITRFRGTDYGDFKREKKVSSPRNRDIVRGQLPGHRPPIPVWTYVTPSATYGQVALADSHMRLWVEALFRGYRRILVLEDDVMVTKEWLMQAPSLFAGIDQGGTWHFLMLRRMPSKRDAKYDDAKRDREWTHGSDAVSGVFVKRSRPSWGTAAYVLSREGMEFLAAPRSGRISYYWDPLDVMLAGMMAEDPEFVALTACEKFPSDIHQGDCGVYEARRDERGACGGLSVRGGRFLSREFETAPLRGHQWDLEYLRPAVNLSYPTKRYHDVAWQGKQLVRQLKRDFA